MSDLTASARLNSPYRGILPFRYVDRSIFFGRERETQELTAKIVLYRLVILFGESGAGKSSLLNAGVNPALLAQGIATELVRVRPFEEEPLTVERTRGGDEGSPFLATVFPGEISGSGEEFSCSMAEFRTTLQEARPEPPVLIFDQFEEIFTLFDASKQRLQRELLGLILNLLECAHARIVIGIREDFLGHLEILARHYPQVFDRRVRLGLLSATAAKQAIIGAFEKPHHFPSTVAVSAADAIIADFSRHTPDSVIHSTQLQVVCSRLWNARASRQPEITQTDLMQLGGVAGLLSGFLESEMGTLTTADRENAYRLLGYLVTGPGTRDVVSEERLRTELGIPGVDIRQLLELLEERKLVNRTSQRNTFYYEVASEYLIAPIRARNETRVREAAMRKAADQEKLLREEAARERGISRKLIWLSVTVGLFALIALATAVLAIVEYQGEKRTAQANANAGREIARLHKEREEMIAEARPPALTGLNRSGSGSLPGATIPAGNHEKPPGNPTRILHPKPPFKTLTSTREQNSTILTHIAVALGTQKVTIDELRRVTDALQIQVHRDLAPHWGVDADVTAYGTLDSVPIDAWPVILKDDINQPGAGAYHSDNNGHPFAVVMFNEDWMQTTQTMSHQILEMLVDPFGNRLVKAPSIDPADKGAPMEYLVQICDPVEDAQYAYKIRDVTVSNFLLPAFYDTSPKTAGPYSFNPVLTAPLQVLPGGYISFQNPVTKEWKQVFVDGTGKRQFRSLGKISSK